MLLRIQCETLALNSTKFESSVLSLGNGNYNYDAYWGFEVSGAVGRGWPMAKSIRNMIQISPAVLHLCKQSKLTSQTTLGEQHLFVHDSFVVASLLMEVTGTWMLSTLETLGCATL